MAVCVLFALHYPLSSYSAIVLVVLGAAAFFAFPLLWVVALAALSPIIGFAPWTGWISAEETDMLVLCIAAAGYLRLAVAKRPEPGSGAIRDKSVGHSALPWLFSLLFTGSVVMAAMRGIADAGGFQWGWFQGYHEPMNSLRLAKPFLEALLLIPLWRHLLLQRPGKAEESLALGFMLGLTATALAAIWEPAAFTGLADFTTDYRTTALFWEMHVGGAALDGFLALCVPFALSAWMMARSPLRWASCAVVLALAAYASLTTFSRGVYVAVPLGIVVCAGMHLLQRRRLAHLSTTTHDAREAASKSGPLWGLALLLVAGFGITAALAFQDSGYRGLAALLACFMLLLPIAATLRSLKGGQWMVSTVLGFMILAIGSAFAWLVPKGVYIAWVAVFLATVALVAWLRSGRRPSPIVAPLALACFLTMIVGTVAIAGYWGGSAGFWGVLPALVLLLALCAGVVMARRPLWPDDLRWQATIAGLIAVTASVVAVFAGGAYMGSRFSTGERDLEGRFHHWEIGKDMLQSPADWLLGKGLGRFPSSYFTSGNPAEHPGDYRLKQEAGERYLTLTGGLHVNGWGEIFRVTQRISPPGGPVVVNARVRTSQDMALHFEICEKHLLYNRACTNKDVDIKKQPGNWQAIRVDLPPEDVQRGSWYAPRLIAFSMAVASRGGEVDIDDVSLTTIDGRELLTNGGFGNEMAHWFFSSDKHHLPWHAKNLPLHLMIEQGLIGLVLWALMMVGALWRTVLGDARGHVLAPPLAASLLSFVAVGAFDSLLDIPRVGMLFYLLMLMAWTLPATRASQRPAGPGAARGAASLVCLAVLCGAFALAPTDVQAVQPREQPSMDRPPLRVGPGEAIRSIAQAARVARDGDTVEVEAGDYVADVAVWTQDRLQLRAVGGRVRLVAAGAAAEGKAIWVVRGGRITVDGFDFSGARVVDRNGAGIRLEKGTLTVRDCSFSNNENGILTANDPQTVLEIVNSEFGHNGHGDGRSHNLYAGTIARLSVTGSYFHHANVGHLLKSRAAVSDIRYSRLTDESGGQASYELEFPNGGIAYVVGNIIAQSATTQNPYIVSYGVEGYRWPTDALYLVNNTLVNERSQGGGFLRVSPGAVHVKVVNNLLVGTGQLDVGVLGDYRNNPRVAERALEGGAADGYGLPGTSPLVGVAVDSGTDAGGSPLRPMAQYRHPRGTLPLQGSPHNPGASQPPGRGPQP